jgi:hypothetical protein
LPVERLYKIDITGDRNNLVFGYLYRADIPRYSMKRFCLGLRPGERLTFTKSMGYAIGRSDDASASQMVRYTKPKNLPQAIPGWRRYAQATVEQWLATTCVWELISAACWCGVHSRKRTQEDDKASGDEDKDSFRSAKGFVAIDVSSDSEGEADEEEVLEDYLTRRCTSYRP